MTRCAGLFRFSVGGWWGEGGVKRWGTEIAKHSAAGLEGRDEVAPERIADKLLRMEQELRTTEK